MSKHSKKKATEMTTDELSKRLFPKQIREEIHRLAEESDHKAKQRSSRKV